MTRSKVLALCALAAVAQAGLLPEPHYSHAGAVSSQSIVRHDEPAHLATKLIAAPVAKLAVATPVVYHAAPAPISYHAAQAQAHYSDAGAVSSQSIVRHDEQPHLTKLVTAPVAKLAVAAPVAYHSALAPVAYHSAPVAKLVAHHEEEIAYPKYEYSYSVVDGHTGNNKSQQESRDGDVVKGSYSLHEADGSIRTVEYSADDHSGFNAVVHNTAPTHAPVALKVAPVVLKAPVYVAPSYYHY